MLQLLISILSTLLIPSRGLLSFAPGLRITRTLALVPISSPPNLSTLNVSVPSIPPLSNYPSNLTTWPTLPIRYIVKNTCIIDITALSIPSPQSPSLDVLYSIISIREEIDNMGDPHDAFSPIEVFERGPITIVFVTFLPNHMLNGIASNILDAVWELFYYWGIVELKTVQVSTFGGIGFSVLSLEIRTDSISPRDLSTATNTSQPSLSQQSNLTLWPRVPFIHVVPPSTTIRINALSVAADMPSDGAMFEALNRMKDYLDNLFPSPQALMPPNFVSEEATSVTTGISVTFSSGQGNWYTWPLARSVLVAVTALEQLYGSVQLDEVIVSVEGEKSDRTFRLEKFDRHPNAGNIILPHTLLPSSIPTLSLSANGTLSSTGLQVWPTTPINVEIVPERVNLIITKLIPVQGYPTIKADIEAMYDELKAEGQPEDRLPSYVALRKGRLIVLFYSKALTRSIAFQTLFNVGILETLHGAAEIERAWLVIDGTRGGFSVGIGGGPGNADEDAEPIISRRSLHSNDKESIIFSPLSPSQNLTIHDLPANLTAWPTLPLYLQIDNNLYINITAISPAPPPYDPIIDTIIDIIQALMNSKAPAEAPLPLTTKVLEFARVRATFTSVAPYRLTYKNALAIMDTVLELEQDYGVVQLDRMDIMAGRHFCGWFSLVISDPPPPPPPTSS
ncbi:hypothetical protein JMJ35_004947 [Cladonia borealis]|uniref:Uncharacterized protein n=1 Tax=Cladonia borealis TaxID=184061 RepID=A0AA39R378_9LECA|nr:hypothetical protein JMJ35_004947 [Cladonia borealis]